jgi:hypothetical protein
MAPDVSSNPKPQTEAPQSFWRQNPQDSPLTPAFSPFTPSLQIPPPQNWPTSQTEASPRDDLSWSVPQRSISYSNLEGLQQHHQQHYTPYSHAPSHPIADAHYTTKPRVLQSSGNMYPPPISTSGSVLPPPEPASASSEAPHHPHSAHSLPPVPFSNWQQQPYSYQKPASAGPEQHYGEWNAPQGGPQHLQGEGAHPPQPGYGYGEHATGMYYPPPHPR